MPQFTHDISESKVPRYHRTRDIIGRDYICDFLEVFGQFSKNLHVVELSNFSNMF